MIKRSILYLQRIVLTFLLINVLAFSCFNVLTFPHSAVLTSLRFNVLTFSRFNLSTSPVYALEQGGQDIAILKLGVGARALGVGSAFTAIADTADAPAWNAAGLGFIDFSSATTMQTKLSTDANYYYVSYVQPIELKGVNDNELKRDLGTIGISWIQIGLGNIANTASGVDRYNEVTTIGNFNYAANAYMLAYGKSLNDKLSLGVTAKYLTSDMYSISGGSAYGYSISPALLFKATERVSAGLVLHEMVNAQKWGTDTVETVPSKLKLGVAFRLPAGLIFSSDFAQQLKSAYSPTASFGLEWGYKTLAFRAGNDEGALTGGFGFRIERVGFDYAYVSQSAMSKDNVHRLSLSGYW